MKKPGLVEMRGQLGEEGGCAAPGPTVLCVNRESSHSYLETVAVMELPVHPFLEWPSLASGWGRPGT